MQPRIVGADLAELATGRDAVAVGLFIVFVDDAFTEHRLIVVVEHGARHPAVVLELELDGPGHAAIERFELLVVQLDAPEPQLEGQGPVSASSG